MEGREEGREEGEKVYLRYEKEILEYVFYQHIGDMYHYKLRQPY